MKAWEALVAFLVAVVALLVLTYLYPGVFLP